MFSFAANGIDWRLILLVSSIGLLLVGLIVVTCLITYKTYQKILIQKRAQIEYYEHELNELFGKRVSILSAFNKDAKNLETPNLYTNMAEKAAFKKETDKYIKSKLTNDVLMNNNAEIAQIVNEYNRHAQKFNQLIKKFPAKIVANRYGFTPYELYDESVEEIDAK